MELIVRQGDREDRVRLRRTDEGYEVTIGDRVHHVDGIAVRDGIRAFRVDAHWHDLNGPCSRVRRAPLLPVPGDEERDWDWV